MRKMTLYCFVISLQLMLIVSCSNQARETEDTSSIKFSYPYHVDLIEGLNNRVDYFLLSDIADSIRFVPLETSEKCLIGSVNRVELDGENVFINASHGQTSSYYFRFNTDGKFLNTVGRIGRGPGEYLQSSFSLDIEKKRVVIFRWLGGLKDFIAFNYDGSFYGKCTYPPQPKDGVSKFEILSGSRLLLQDFGYLLMRADLSHNTLTNDLTLYKIYDSTGYLITSIPHPIAKHTLEDGKNYQSGFSINSDISFFNGTARMSAQDHDTAYMVRGDSILPAFIFHRGNLNPDFIQRYGYLNNRGEGRFLSSNFSFYETDEFMFRLYLLNSTNESFMFRYNKLSGNVDSQASGGGNFKDDLSDGSNLSFRIPTNMGDDVWVQVVPAKAFKERFSGGTPPTDSVKRRFYDNRIEVAESITDDDNPVLVLVYLKSTGSSFN